MTIESSIPASLLYNEGLLQYLLGNQVDGLRPQDSDEPFDAPCPYELYARREFQLREGFRDNEVFASRWGSFQQSHAREMGGGSLALAALAALCDEYLEASHGSVHVQLERYADWQNLMAGINFHPIIAYAMQDGRLAGRCLPPLAVEEQEAGRAHDGYYRWGNNLCYPYDNAVEDYIRSKGLNDAHLHLNACAYAEASWLHAVCHPRESYDHIISRAAGAPMLQQFLETFGNQPTATLEKHLQIAANIRSILRAHTYYPPHCSACYYSGAALDLVLQACPPTLLLGQLSDVELQGPRDGIDWEADDFPAIIQQERQWMSGLIHSLLQSSSPAADYWIAGLLHVYLLLMNEYCNLLTVRETQKGFNQFDHTQGIPHFLSWHPNYYVKTFKHFHGQEQDSMVHYLDARIAPKTQIAANKEQLELILQDYLRYLDWVARKERNPFTPRLEGDDFELDVEGTCRHIHGLTPCLRHRYLHLNLTAHFIKQKRQAWEEGNSYRHHQYRDELHQQVEALHSMLLDTPVSGRFLRGIDAASDEQNIPPSVLAPCFRACRRALHLDHVTFHCGEDFPHLLTGMRALQEALLFLELKRGDRIGHATAIGIHPSYWAANSPAQLWQRREERMLDLLFAYHSLKHVQGADNSALHAFHDELMRHAHSMFSGLVDSFTLYELEVAMRLRQLDPKSLCAWFGKKDAARLNIQRFKQDADSYRLKDPDDFPRGHPEYEQLKTGLTESPQRSLELLMAWFTEENVWRRGQDFVKVEERREYASLYLRIQQQLMHEVCRRGIIIETLLTSNLRIACYRHAREHHAMRWLHCGKAAVEGDPHLQLAFGSDDPGIFSCDAKAEFYLLYACLREHGVAEQEALRMLHDVNRRGRVYSFENTNRPHAASGGCLTPSL